MVRQLFSTSPPTLSPLRWNRNEIERNRICSSFPRTRDIAIYISGALFAIGWWAFVDAIVYTTINKTTPFDNITVLDWISGIITTIGMLIVGSIDKTIFSDEIYTYSVSKKTFWKVRLMLFLGSTLLAGGLLCSLTVFTIKYILTDARMELFYFGVAVVVQNVCVFMSSIVLLIGQRATKDTEYSLLS
ncbi:4963_t:CDS:2 [Acaulospora morrowiae]|uniref:4963_t:CDS:1 n=1 Tax=Acaulospora morrowiae TaxID=94023 RepID=A0A9N9F4E7_9GLOM|nr:4963_t:CDS:2 [Acaulospora morrowiae]